MDTKPEKTEKTPLKESSPTENGSGDKNTFSSSLSLVLSCLGCAVGTGNIWRFPRIVAASSGDGGALVFILVWVGFLFIGSIPVLLIEYGAGRYTRKGLIQTFYFFLGPKATWCSLFISLVNMFISSYYHVIVGWCMYYTIRCMVYPLPQNYEESKQVFNSFAQESYWPLLTLALAHICSSISIIKGVRTIEKVNLVLTPALLIILFFIFIWSITRHNALDGIAFMFNPDWDAFMNPKIWLNAASQNAFDTSAGTGQFLTYSAFMAREHNIVKYSLGVPMGNNLVSLTCGMTTFSTAFASLTQTRPNITTPELLHVLQQSGPGGTGMAFMWLPVLLAAAGVTGRVIAVFLFLAMVFAGITSSVAYNEVVVHPLKDLGLDRKFAVPLMMCVQYGLGCASALNLEIMDNQDTTWGYALLIVALMLQVMAIMYGANLFREHIINAYGKNDYTVPKIWVYLIKFVSPMLSIMMLIWWVVNSIMETGADWYHLKPTSVFPVTLQWIGVIGVLLGLNYLILYCKPDWASRPLDSDKKDGALVMDTVSSDQHSDDKVRETELSSKE